MKYITNIYKSVHLFFTLLLLFPGYALGTHAGSFSNIFVFGDSLSDNGNVSATIGGAFQPIPFGSLIPSAPYAGGRFSDGPVWSELLAASLGTPLTPVLAGGTNFAFGGARTGHFGAAPLPSPTLLEQFAIFSGNTGGTAPSDALYLIWGGANDVRDAVKLELSGNNSDAGALVDQSVANITSLAAGLSAMGAVDIMVGNLPDLGLTPEASYGGGGMMRVSTRLTGRFNSLLDLSFDQRTSSPETNIIEMDIFGLFSSVLGSPESFGFSNVFAPCVDIARVCSNPEDYLFYDGIHPTAGGHQLLADFALTHVIPEPTPGILALMGLFFLGIYRLHSFIIGLITRKSRSSLL